MKIEDLAGNRIVAYDSSLERFDRFCQYLNFTGRGKLDIKKGFVRQPCVIIAKTGYAFLCEMSEAVKENYFLVPAWAFCDFMKFEHQFETEQEEKIQKILDEVFSKSDTGQESSVCPPISMQGLDGIKNLGSQKLKELFPQRDISKLRVAGGLAGEERFKA